MNLSVNEKTVLNALAAGLKPCEIAARRNWAENTVRCFVARAKRKLRTRTTVQTVVRYKQLEGLINGA